MLYIEVFKLYKIKETKPSLLLNQNVKLRENVIEGCAIMRDKCISNTILAKYIHYSAFLFTD